MKLYFEDSKDANFCASLEFWEKFLKENDFDQIALVEAKKVNDLDYFFCKRHQAVGEKGNCGKDCNEYKPRNGKSGICNYYGFCYEPTDKKHLLKLSI